MRLRPLSLSLLLLFSITAAYSQQVERKFVCTLPDTSAEKLSHLKVDFNADGNYCYYNQNGEGIVVTNTGTYGPFKTSDDRYGPIIFYNEKDTQQYIMGNHSGTMCGPIDGDIDVTSYPLRVCDYFSFIASRTDSFGYYINGRLIATTGNFPCAYYWCVFSGNGHVLYTIKKGRRNYLYLDYKLIDSTLGDYDRLQVDDEGHFSYKLGSHEPGRWRNLAKFKPYPGDKQKAFPPVAAYGDVRLKYSDSSYLVRNRMGRTYFLVGDSVHGESYMRRLVITPGKEKNFLSYELRFRPFGHTPGPGDSVTTIHVNDKTINLPYTNIFMPYIDSSGCYAVFGQRGYYVYRNVNGTELTQPLSKHGVRATPVSIDVQGNTICYYQTDDSVYVYENDRLFGSCALTHFKLLRQDVIIPAYQEETKSISGRESDLTGFCLDSACYLVYRNAISPPLHDFSYNIGEMRVTGDIIYSDINEHGYCVLQKTGNHQYRLMVNNRYIPFPPGADFDTMIWFWLSRNFSFTGNEFVFYSQEGASIYQYKMKL